MIRLKICNRQTINHKGSAGKTSCSIGAAYALAKRGFSVLALDSDPQGNFTDNLSVEIYDLISTKKTLYDALYNNPTNKPIADFICHTEYDNLDLLASDSHLIDKTQELESQMGRFEYPYRKLLDSVRKTAKYDFVIIDTRPSIGGENTQVFIASDYVAIPTTTGARSTSGIIRILESVNNCNSSIKGCDVYELLYTATGDKDYLKIEAKVYYYDQISDDVAREIVSDTNFLQRGDLSATDRAFCIYNKYEAAKKKAKESGKSGDVTALVA